MTTSGARQLPLANGANDSIVPGQRRGVSFQSIVRATGRWAFRLLVLLPAAAIAAALFVVLTLIAAALAFPVALIAGAAAGLMAEHGREQGIVWW